MKESVKIALASTGVAVGVVASVLIGVYQKKQQKLTRKQKAVKELENMIEKSRAAINDLVETAGKSYSKAKDNGKAKVKEML